MALASVIYDVNNDFICHGLLRPYLSSERIAALDHCKALEALGILKGAVLVFDRGYYSEAMFRYFSDNGYHCVMRIRENIMYISPEKITSHGRLDHPSRRNRSPFTEK